MDFKKWRNLATFFSYWILFFSFLVALTIVIAFAIYYSIKGIIVYIRWIKDERNRAVRVVDASQFENVARLHV